MSLLAQLDIKGLIDGKMKPENGYLSENTLTHIKIPNSNDALLSECEVETFRSGGKGGQHANKTESAVRLTHTKSGIKVTCQDERSQYLNKIKCLKELRVRIEKYNFKPIMWSKFSICFCTNKC